LAKSPFFSIIIPTYNRAHTIRRPIESVLAQTFTDWELIIVDDGSTDDTKSVVESYQDGRIRYVWQENQERSAARNHGIKIAKGEWICFQDSDDEYLQNHLEVLLRGIERFPEYKLFRTGMLIYVNGKLSKVPKFDVENEYELYPFDAFTTFTFKKEILNDLSFESTFFNSEDLHLLIRVNAKYPLKIIHKYTNIYNYNFSNSGGLGLNYHKVHSNKIKVFKDLLNSDNNIKCKYIERKLCLSNLLILIGHFKYNRNLLFGAIKDFCFLILINPKPYLLLMTRIIYVKLGELTGLYHNDYRF